MDSPPHRQELHYGKKYLGSKESLYRVKKSLKSKENVQRVKKAFIERNFVFGLLKKRKGV